MTGKISGAILAGGSGSRFGGKIKAKLEIQGETIISRIIATIEGVSDEKIIVTNSPGEFASIEGCRIITDKYANAGPLAGIHAALSEASGEAVFIIAGDMPYPDIVVIEQLISAFYQKSFDVIVPSVGLHIEPLHAIYHTRILDSLELFIREGKSNAIRDFLATVNTGYLEFPLSDRIRKAFTNINYPADLDHLVL